MPIVLAAIRVGASDIVNFVQARNLSEYRWKVRHAVGNLLKLIFIQLRKLLVQGFNLIL